MHIQNLQIIRGVWWAANPNSWPSAAVWDCSGLGGGSRVVEPRGTCTAGRFPGDPRASLWPRPEKCSGALRPWAALRLSWGALSKAS